MADVSESEKKAAQLAAQKSIAHHLGEDKARTPNQGKRGPRRQSTMDAIKAQAVWLLRAEKWNSFSDAHDEPSEEKSPAPEEPVELTTMEITVLVGAAAIVLGSAAALAVIAARASRRS